MKINFRNQDGFSLLSVLMAAGMMGLLAAVLSKQLTTGFQASESVKIKSELNFLMNQVSQGISCDRTAGPPGSGAACSGGAIQLRNGAGNPINFPTKMANRDFTGEAFCNSVGGRPMGIHIRFRFNNTAKDPLTGKPLNKGTWNYFGDPTTTGFCVASFTNATGGCRADEFVQTVTPDGQHICKSIRAEMRHNGRCADTQKMVGFNDNGTIRCITPKVYDELCPVGSFLRGFDRAGTKICEQLPEPPTPDTELYVSSGRRNCYTRGSFASSHRAEEGGNCNARIGGSRCGCNTGVTQATFSSCNAVATITENAEVGNCYAHRLGSGQWRLTSTSHDHSNRQHYQCKFTCSN